MVLAGLSVSRNTGGGGEESVSGNMLAGYKIGVITNIPLRKTGSISLQTGMLLNEWGSSFANQPLRFRYIEMPLLLSNRFWLSPLSCVELGAGPYIACRINSPSQAFLLEQNGNHYEGILSADCGTEYKYERLDYGLSFSGSFDIYSKFNISLTYDEGLQNIIGYGSDISLRNQAFSLSRILF